MNIKAKAQHVEREKNNKLAMVEKMKEEGKLTQIEYMLLKIDVVTKATEKLVELYCIRENMYQANFVN